MNSCRVRECQKPISVNHQFVNEDVGIPPPSHSSKRKKNGASDPRFKRVINSELRNDGCPEIDSRKINSITSIPKMPHAFQSHINEDRTLADKMISYLKSPNESSTFVSGSFKKFEDQKDICQQDLSEVVTKDVGFNPSMKYLSDCDVLGYPNENFKDNSKAFDSYKHPDKRKINSSTNLKRSASDCTLHTKNTFAEDNEDENMPRVRPYPSATRLNKVQNWIKDYKMQPEKRRSVITVIGQTQTKSFSKILNEINQRRKLAKELDKHALCEAIMENAESSRDVKNLVAKVDFVLPDGKVVYSAEKVYLCKNSSKFKMEKDCGEYAPKSLEVTDAPNQVRKRCEMIPERDSSLSQLCRRGRTKRPSKKLGVPIKEKIRLRSKIKSFFSRIWSKLFWTTFFLLFFAGVSYGIFYLIKPTHPSFLNDLFKPKSTAWYEKLLF